MVMRVGVLALQGDWLAHRSMLAPLGVEAEPVRTAAELERADALVIPGGESTAMLRLMESERLDELMAERIRGGMPALGICAGLILLAAQVEPEQPSLGVLDVEVVRNAFGRQVHSTILTIEVDDELGEPGSMEAVLIRAPRITRQGNDVKTLGRSGEEAVLVRQGRVIGSTFHPELTGDGRVHRMFCELAEGGDG
jgi:5'-phosphate synthase pdxT subunit